MTKKTKTTAKTLTYRFVKTLPEAKAPNPKTTFGVIYQTIRKVKQGTLDELTSAAIKHGLKNFSDQNPRAMTRLFLRQLVNGGSVSQARTSAKRVTLVASKEGR